MHYFLSYSHSIFFVEDFAFPKQRNRLQGDLEFEILNGIESILDDVKYLKSTIRVLCNSNMAK